MINTIVKTAVSFNNAVKNTVYVASGRRIQLNSELEKRCKDSAVLHSQTQYSLLSGGAALIY
jgi:hypothetical protein